MSEAKLDVAIIDYSMSNLYSVQAACTKVGLGSKITSESALILNAKAAILPGVGAFGEAAEKIRQLGLDEVIREFIGTGKPFVGICLGMQLLFSESEEFGQHKGLDIVQGRVRKLVLEQECNKKYPVPHIGWNRIEKIGTGWKGNFLEGNMDQDFMYFVHSFYAVPTENSVSIAQTTYGPTTFCSAISIDNVFATQFHPEKSGFIGLKVYERLKQLIYTRNKD